MRQCLTPLVAACAASLLTPPAAAQGPAPDATTRGWTLSSGDVTWRLVARGGRLLTVYLGPGGPAVGDTDRAVVKPGAPPGWHDFMFRVAMNGQFGISSRVHEWDAALSERAKTNVALYERVRARIANGDTYHLTDAPPNVNPRGWMAIQYVVSGGDRSIATAYRLAGGEATRTFPLRGLRAERDYVVRRDGQLVATVRGADLASRGLPVALDAEWRAAVFELEAAAR